ncbi:metal-sulfur cluster assembly factor [Halobacterium sp. KA-6]|uniref:metal-sulfur cluster assembly factor n=1 Tax=Halobacterium sp. KA-6 TaxID=2896368 RepID=UPI001E611222|nr:metal-sulfur cluster assembly factor [Halobacterium sp. KA-6]MCD2204039.1 metal-sulfur cluster assembly factor [Halobacterium sp. KA-6]
MSTDTTDTTTTPPADPERAIEQADATTRNVWAALRSVQDPELPISVVDLGLIYDVAVTDGRVEIDLTLTYTGCPAKDIITGDIERAVIGVEGINEVDITTVYSPAWDYDRITDRGREQLNEYGIAVPGYDEAPDPTCHN